MKNDADLGRNVFHRCQGEMSLSLFLFLIRCLAKTTTPTRPMQRRRVIAFKSIITESTEAGVIWEPKWRSISLSLGFNSTNSLSEITVFVSKITAITTNSILSVVFIGNTNLMSNLI